MVALKSNVANKRHASKNVYSSPLDPYPEIGNDNFNMCIVNLFILNKAVAQNVLNFMQFFGKFGKIVYWRSPPPAAPTHSLEGLVLDLFILPTDRCSFKMTSYIRRQTSWKHIRVKCDINTPTHLGI